ncbi:TATA box-binding protein-associated factor RNA polymerase I subunit B-like isoform X2 [Tachypleus tridentatus]|uniref:TATA box-binding protein-associated factor RNA polymerase I subunit B-like isoform X2 n=1 Tax=Tachypleus tridentatus TaxID=6853 RepID=UPI003FCF802F
MKGICNICDGNTLKLESGRWFCEECFSQQQELYETRKNVCEVENYSCITHKNAQQSRPLKHSQKVVDVGEPWIYAEAFNIIIQKQVEILIQLGASSSLKNSEEIERENECALSLMMKLDEEEKKFIKEHLKTNGEKIVLSNSPTDWDLPDTKEKNSEKGKQNQVFKDLLQKDEKYLTKFASKQVEYMTVRKTLCFCYLGLLLLRESILLSDLLRWCKVGILPLLDAGNCLPPSMKLQAIDIPAFQIQELPYPSYIDLETGKLAHYLGVSTIPPQQLEPIVARHLKELNLPSEILLLVKCLLDIFPPHLQWDFSDVALKVKADERHNLESLSIPPFEARAVAYVIVALKLLFGIDGTTEREISSHLKKISKFLPTGVNLFSFADWMQYIDARNVFLSSRYTTFCFPNTEKIIDIDEFFAFYHCIIIKVVYS